MAGGRPSKYETNVKPYFEQIRKWLKQGATERQIAEQLGIAYSTYNDYKVKYSEFSEVVKGNSRVELVEELRGALVKKALGFEYKEKKEYIKVEVDDEGKEVGRRNKYLEITTKQSLPDTTALFGALNIYDPDYVRDKKNHELREKDYELRKAIAEANNFDLDIK